MQMVRCEWCGKSENVTATRAKTYRFCSRECRGQDQTQNLKKENSPLWQGGDRTKVCAYCGKPFSIPRHRAISLFRNQKFCSHECGVLGRDTTGDNNPNWKGGVAPRNSSLQGKWSDAVITRDAATCQHCGATGIELHAHHIKPYKKHPELRWDVGNGITLCHKCHWKVHTAPAANAVNSGKPLTVQAEGNPEPSPDGNIREGVTTRGRPYRRLDVECPTCGKPVSRKLSETKGRLFIACSYECAARYREVLRSTGVIPPRAPRAKAMI